MAQDDRLSPAPLLTSGSKEDCSGASMTTSAISPAPEETKIKMTHPEAAPTPVAQPVAQQYSQDSIRSASGAKVNPVTLCVYTLDTTCSVRLSFESGRLTTAQQVLSKMRGELAIPEEIEQVFSVWLTSKYLQLQLKSYHLPCKLFKRWKDLLSQFTTATYEEISQDEPILSFQRNAFLTLKEERNLLKKQKSDDSNNYCKAIDLLYHEAVFNTTRGRYPLSVEEFHSQAGLQAAVKHLEEGNKSPTTVPALKPEMFYPPHMRPKGGLNLTKLFKKSPETRSIADELSKAFKYALKKCSDPHQLKILYLQLCWHKPYYGSVFFKGIVEKPLKLLVASEKHIVVAINTECVHLMTATSSSDILLYLTFDQLSWEFQAPDTEGEGYFSSLLLEFDSFLEADNYKKVSKRVQIFSRQAPMMDAMISRCVDCINKQEEKLRQLRLQQGNKEFLEHNIKTSDGRVQRQELNHKEHKLQCTVLNAEGVAFGSRFTLSRVLRKKSKVDVAAGEETAPLTPGDEMSTVGSPLEEGGGATRDHSTTIV